ncbi:hypothetical protein MIR68_008662 [Amoeboaphelidium protococcarum]|nr:hypothetical protein MIR68_008662 [Amoeboaphelidium protococcarum]
MTQNSFLARMQSGNGQVQSSHVVNRSIYSQEETINLTGDNDGEESSSESVVSANGFTDSEDEDVHKDLMEVESKTGTQASQQPDIKPDMDVYAKQWLKKQENAERVKQDEATDNNDDAASNVMSIFNPPDAEHISKQQYQDTINRVSQLTNHSLRQMLSLISETDKFELDLKQKLATRYAEVSKTREQCQIRRKKALEIFGPMLG